MKRSLLLLLAFLMLFSLSGNALIETELRNDNSPATRPENIDIELWEYMMTASSDELISIDICLSDIDEAVVFERLNNERGMDHEIYCNEARFETEIKSKIEAVLEECLGYDRAHGVSKTEASSIFISDCEKAEIKNAFETKLSYLAIDCETLLQSIASDGSCSPIEYAIMLSRQAFQAEKNKIVREEYVRMNSRYIEKYVYARERKVTYMSKYTSSIILEATKSDIFYFAEQKETIKIFYIKPVDSICSSNNVVYKREDNQYGVIEPIE